MTASGAIKRPFGAEERAFVLNVGTWRDLEKARGVGLPVLAGRIAPIMKLIAHPGGPAAYKGGIFDAAADGLLGMFFLDDVRETLLQGLIGGGMSSIDAGVLVRKVFDESVNRGQGPVFTFAPMAFEILSVALFGLEDEPIQPGEPKAAEPRARRRSQTRGNDSRTSTPSAP